MERDLYFVGLRQLIEHHENGEKTAEITKVWTFVFMIDDLGIKYNNHGHQFSCFEDIFV